MIFPLITSEWDITPTIEALVQCGLSEPVEPNLRNGLYIALSHESFIYENSQAMTGATAGLLTALSSLGKTFLARTAAVHLYRTMAFDGPGPLSERIGHVASTFPE